MTWGFQLEPPHQEEQHRDADAEDALLEEEGSRVQPRRQRWLQRRHRRVLQRHQRRPRR